MQPLAYFAIRCLVSWLQFLERETHAFVFNAAIIVATGAAHCWAVVYALFIAIHTRAMRFHGYHERYTEHLPFWVEWTETLAVASMGIWWFAGFITAAIRVMDDDARDLPMEQRDVEVDLFRRVMRSPLLHGALGALHMLSCVGLFTSILLLCVAMGLMSGAVTSCEICLCLVSIGFALPHAVVAASRLSLLKPKRENEGTSALVSAAQAAALEAASCGPQLCVILALADSPGHAYPWQNLAYLVAAATFLASVVACGRSPPKASDAVLPPLMGEFAACNLLNIVAAIVLVICFPHLHNGAMWCMMAIFLVFLVSIWFEGVRDLCIELLDPLLAVRSDTDKAFPGQLRQRVQRVAWVMGVACGVVALWDIMLHPVQEGLLEPPTEPSMLDTGPEIGDLNTMLLLRWKPPPLPEPGESFLLAVAAEVLGIDLARLQSRMFLPEHRIMFFGMVSAASSTAPRVPAHALWKEAMLAPQGELLRLADETFPEVLNTSMCMRGQIYVEMARREDPEAVPPVPIEFYPVLGKSPDAYAAYIAVCDWWTSRLTSFHAAGGTGDFVPNEPEPDSMYSGAVDEWADSDDVSLDPWRD